MKIIVQWLVNFLAIIVFAYVLPGIKIESFYVALVAAVILGLLNTLLKPIILVITLPINILTLGLFTLVINALMVMFAAMLVPGFMVASFWWALLFGLIISVVNFLASR